MGMAVSTPASRHPLIPNPLVWYSMYLEYHRTALQIFLEEIEVFRFILGPGVGIVWSKPYLGSTFRILSLILYAFVGLNQPCFLTQSIILCTN